MVKFICDEMLQRLGRWLRAAGYDTKIASNSLKDCEIFDVAYKEHRLVITRDRHFKQMKDPQHLILFLQGNALEECVRELNEYLAINWLYQPFSRCLVCNTPLIALPNATLLTLAPLDIQQLHQDIRYCQSCHKLYWQGSHAQRMLKTLSQWQSLRE